MSEGPIKRWRDSWKPPKVSTDEAHRVCADEGGRGYCGRHTPQAKRTDDWDKVTCADCQAARRADEAAGVTG